MPNSPDFYIASISALDAEQVFDDIIAHVQVLGTPERFVIEVDVYHEDLPQSLQSRVQLEAGPL